MGGAGGRQLLNALTRLLAAPGGCPALSVLGLQGTNLSLGAATQVLQALLPQRRPTRLRVDMSYNALTSSTSAEADALVAVVTQLAGQLGLLDLSESALEASVVERLARAWAVAESGDAVVGGGLVQLRCSAPVAAGLGSSTDGLGGDAAAELAGLEDYDL